jgi:Tol biopolymer transport system component
MSIRCRRSVAVAVLLVAAGCTSAPEGTDTTTTTSPPTTSSHPTFSLTVHDSAFVLDLRTGTERPLPSTSVDDSRVRFNDGHYYAVSPNGSMVYWEDDCCSAADVAAVARSDGSQARRLDPTGRINYYAGGWSPDSTKIVYQQRDGSGDAGPFGDLVVEDMVSGRKTRIELGVGSQSPESGWWYLAPIFSPDGRNVIFQLPRGPDLRTKWDLWSVPVTGGKATLLVKNAAQATSSDRPIWAFVRPKEEFFDGTRLVIATPDGFRTLVEASVGIFEPKMSPDGRRIAYQDGDSIYVVDVSTGESSEVAVGRMAAWLDDDTLVVAPDKP